MSLGAGAKKSSYSDALAGDPMGFSTTSGPSLPEAAQGLRMSLEISPGPLLGALLEHLPNLSLDLPSSPAPSLLSAQRLPVFPCSVKGPPSPEMPEPDCRRSHPLAPLPPCPTLQSITEPCPVLHPKMSTSVCSPVSTVTSSSRSGSLWPSLPPTWSLCLHPPLPQARSPPAARVISGTSAENRSGASCCLEGEGPNP